MGALPVLADRHSDLIDAINRPIRRDIGQAGFGQQVLWTDFDGATASRNGSTAGTGLHTHVIRNTAGRHLAVLLAATSPTATPSLSNAVLLVEDGRVAIGGSVPLSLGALPASTGAIRLSNNTLINARNAANTGDLVVSGTDASDNVYLGDTSNVESTVVRAKTSIQHAVGASTVSAQTSTLLTQNTPVTVIASTTGAALTARNTDAAGQGVVATNSAGTTIFKTEDAGITLGALLTLTQGQIAFPATQAASADANTLDDYEEGTWTPELSSTGGTTYALQEGLYIKIGRQVWVTCTLAVTTKDGGASASTITGLPFAPDHNAVGAVSNWSSLAVSVVHLSLLLASGAVTAQLQGATVAAASSSAISGFGNGAAVRWSATYRTAS